MLIVCRHVRAQLYTELWSSCTQTRFAEMSLAHNKARQAEKKLRREPFVLTGRLCFTVQLHRQLNQLLHLFKICHSLYNVSPTGPSDVPGRPEFQIFTLACWQQGFNCHKGLVWDFSSLTCAIPNWSELIM